MKKHIIYLAFICYAMTACNVKQSLEECPPDDGTRSLLVNIFVEQFGSNALLAPPSRAKAPAAGYESRFSDRIESLTYYLYRDNTLLESGPVEDCHTITDAKHVFRRDDLPNGSYSLALMANCTESIMRGDPADLSSLTIAYPGYKDTKDYFIDVLPFTVDRNGTIEMDTHLKRVHGVTRYTFTDIPANVRYVEVSMDGLTSSGCIMGTYSDDYDYSVRIPVNIARASDERTMVGTFPTADGAYSNFNIALYDGMDNLLMEKTLIGNEYTVVRNQLLDLTATVRNGEIFISVGIDPEWGEPNEGGGGEIE